MVKIFVFFLLTNSKNYCQKIPRWIPFQELQKEYISEESIIQLKPIKSRIRNADLNGTLPQQVLIRTFSRYTSSDCTGTMLTKNIAITAAHCVNDRGTNHDVVVYPPAKNCGFLSINEGIEACKVVQKFEETICQANGHDIALVRLSRPMPGMRNLRLNFFNRTIQTGQNTIMAGTGVNFNRTCESQISYQTLVDCSTIRCHGRQWYCSEGSYKETSGACIGDSGGPSWTFGSGLSGLTAAATVDNENDPCTKGNSIFTNLNYYKGWINCNMRGPMSTCAVDLPNVRQNLQSPSHVKNIMQNKETCSQTDADHRNIPNNPNPIINGVLDFIGGAIRLAQGK